MLYSRNGLNIVLYVNSFLPTIGGRELVVHYLAGALREIGHQVRVVGPAGWWSQRKVRFGYPLHRWPTLRGRFVEQVQLLQLLLDTAIWGCDIIHHNTYPTGYIAARLKRIRDLPLVVTPHGEDINIVSELGFGMRLNTAVGPKINYTLERTEMLTAISAGIEASLVNAGALREKIRRIPNGVDVERFQKPAVAADIRKWLKLPAESRVILTVGNYRPCKGHEVLIRSMPLILYAEPNIYLVIVGRGTDKLRPLLRELDLDEKVRLTGSISFPAVASWGQSHSVNHSPDWLACLYRSSEMYVSAGMDEGAEGLSLAVLEAMAAGLPVVATNISGNKDIVIHGDNGFLVPPADPSKLAETVLLLLKSNDIKFRLGRKAKEIAVV
ncbi:MAG: hypothetical protein C4B57_05075 [Deltaproteobacteria bacterium]|nr:MAG: hypothetical protein C4B57_05075 [Deltaproteobacteria bacterium]